MPEQWKIINPDGKNRVIVTKELPGERWLKALALADARVEVCQSLESPSSGEIVEAMGRDCQGAIGQITEQWDRELFEALKAAGGRAYSNYAVGYNNVDVAGATACGIPMGNTPGVLTEATAELCLALTMTAARRVAEGDAFIRGGSYHGWQPTLFLGKQLHGLTVGVIGLGRIGFAFARMLASACHMDVIYHSLHPKPEAEGYFKALGELFASQGERPVTCARVETLEELCQKADVISVNTVLDETTHHLINAARLGLMKEDAVFINASRGPVVDEKALVAHLRAHPEFKAGLDVFEDEPALAPGLAEMKNVVLAPHVGSATSYAREGMATLAACNVSAMLRGLPAWNRPEVSGFLSGEFPPYAPSVVNAAELGYATLD